MFRETSEGVIITVKILPQAHQNKVLGEENGKLKIHIKATPEKGKANAELISFLAKTFSMPKRDILIIKGETSHIKQILLLGMTAEKIKFLRHFYDTLCDKKIRKCVEKD